MGASASIQQSDEELIESFGEIYKTNPARFQRIYAEVVRSTEDNKKGKKEEVTTATAPSNINSDSSELSLAVLDVLNRARTNPKNFVTDVVLPHKKSFEDQYIFNDSVTGNRVKTNEGVALVDETIKYLNSVVPVPPLKNSDFLVEAAKVHALDIGPTGSLQHQGSDGSHPSDRISRFAVWSGSVGENMAFGNSNPVNIVMQLIIDDGVPDRGHRTSIFNKDFHLVGSAIGPHAKFGVCCVMDFAGGLKDKSSLVMHDCEVTCTGEMTAEFRKVIQSIPTSTENADDQDTELCKQVKKSLQDGAKVTLIFTPSQGSAKIKMETSKGTATKSVSWSMG